MRKDLISELHRRFEDVSSHLSGTSGETVECWTARDIQPLLGYDTWRRFHDVIVKAMRACEQSGHEIGDHFVDVGKMVSLGSGAEREVPDILLSRYACYLIAQNGDSKKEPVAFAQTYFALQTRKQELIEERLADAERLEARDKLKRTEKELSGALYQRGIDQRGFAIIRSKGDMALFGGRTTADMKYRLGIAKTRALADFLPTVTIKAKDLAAEMTNHTVRTQNLHGQSPIAAEHVRSNTNVRAALNKSAIYPENLPAAEDAKKLERRVQKEEIELAKRAEDAKLRGR